LALAVLCVGAARGAAPSYSKEGIVNSPNYTPEPFAPGSIVSIFGSGLGESSQGITLEAGALRLPFELNNARVYVGGQTAPMFYASDSQINFQIPPNLVAGPVTIRVAVDGNTLSGPEITVALVDAAPALFPLPPDDVYAIAQHADYSLVTADSPAHAGDIVVIYLTGLGRTNPDVASGEIPPLIELPLLPSDLKVSLGGTVVDPVMVKYAGLTPGCAGLYQINLLLPDNLGTDPELRVAVADQSSPAGLNLPVR
jgi:uncharacterized protein (TIGR03437 family)